jgi:hypothetical protein
MQDDGGYPITGYRIEMLDIQTNHWIEITFIEVSFLNCSDLSSSVRFCTKPFTKTSVNNTLIIK